MIVGFVEGDCIIIVYTIGPKECLRLPRQTTITTPENASITYELAGIASRSSAVVIDLLIQTVAIAILVGFYILALSVLHFEIIGWPTSVLIVLGFVIWWGYFVFFETKWAGQTPGKRICRLRAIMTAGAPVGLTSAALRGLIRVVDINLIGIISIIITPKNQRLGDFAAGTIVVKERSEWKGDLAHGQSSTNQASAEDRLVKNIELVTPEQFEAIKRFTARAAELDADVRKELAAKMARPLMQSLGIEDGPGIDYSNLLWAIYDRCVQNRGLM